MWVRRGRSLCPRECGNKLKSSHCKLLLHGSHLAELHTVKACAQSTPQPAHEHASSHTTNVCRVPPGGRAP